MRSTIRWGADSKQPLGSQLGDNMFDHLVDRLFPTKEVHLVAGPSGAGKTTLMLQLLMEWQEGKPILGFNSHPVPWLYISADRSRRGVIRALQRIGIPQDKIAIECIIEFKQRIKDKFPSSWTAKALIKAIVNSSHPKPQMVFIEGLASLMPKKASSNDYSDVADFLTDLTALCEELDITIIATVHSPKCKEDSRYLDPRQRVLGSVAWAAFSETIIIIESIEAAPDKPSNLRNVIALPRNAAPIIKQYEFTNEGRIVEHDEALDEDLLYAFLAGIAPGQTFKTERVLTIFDGSISNDAAQRRLKRYVEQGLLEKIGQGEYRKPTLPLWVGDKELD